MFQNWTMPPAPQATREAVERPCSLSGRNSNCKKWQHGQNIADLYKSIPFRWRCDCHSQTSYVHLYCVWTILYIQKSGALHGMFTAYWVVTVISSTLTPFPQFANLGEFQACDPASWSRFPTCGAPAVRSVSLS